MSQHKWHVVSCVNLPTFSKDMTVSLLGSNTGHIYPSCGSTANTKKGCLFDKTYYPDKKHPPPRHMEATCKGLVAIFHNLLQGALEGDRRDLETVGISACRTTACVEVVSSGECTTAHAYGAPNRLRPCADRFCIGAVSFRQAVRGKHIYILHAYYNTCTI